ncbi:MarR family winged helix-turn-helix transcriptional regulator [Victivallis sp. Marseille-Q1083]|uniref:MarR family winged helix-turn-helix transcriptional regulator n=1 Tax=Victivallis sp. Marseille-Q1083 TaxID=2717288 RepID=UPI00158C3AEC|nr:MarR family transcriptional regulator [Victivallis sp. Marseille-Q1083]
MSTAVEEEKVWKQLFRTVEDIRLYHGRTTPFSPPARATMTQMRVMGYLIGTLSGSVKVKDIARELGITSGGVSQIVDTLVKSGKVERCRDSSDRRSVCISLSREGRRLQAQIDASFTALFRKLLRSVPEEKLQVFYEVLGAMSHALEDAKQNGEKN